MLGGLWQDVRYGAPVLLKSLTYTAIAVAALVLSLSAAKEVSFNLIGRGEIELIRGAAINPIIALRAE